MDWASRPALPAGRGRLAGRASRSSLAGSRFIGRTASGTAAALAGARRRFAAILCLVGLYHFATRAVIGIGQVHPPLGLDAIHFARFSPQLQEIDRGTEARLLGHAPDGLGGAALETRLHEPDFTHIGLKAALEIGRAHV